MPFCPVWLICIYERLTWKQNGKTLRFEPMLHSEQTDRETDGCTFWMGRYLLLPPPLLGTWPVTSLNIIGKYTIFITLNETPAHQLNTKIPQKHINEQYSNSNYKQTQVISANARAYMMSNGWYKTRTTRTPAPHHDYPYLWFTSDPKSKQDKVKVTNLKNCQKSKFWNFAANFIRDTPSEVAW